ncbi:MAG: twin-arginine translocase TatA/TatE family subunit [Planctomycetaceae bacterium]|nr:twin-arginine translocase TatA/TatE family subunit [Planctomycetaceae bacterium]
MQPTAIFILLIVGVILFGGRLPEIARSIGKGLLEFQRGMNEWGNEAKKTIFEESDANAKSASEPVPSPKPDIQETSAPKFEPPAE